MTSPSADIVVFRVIGELRSDPRLLLLESPDGRWFAYDLSRGLIAPVDPGVPDDCDAWDMVDGGLEARSPNIVA